MDISIASYSFVQTKPMHVLFAFTFTVSRLSFHHCQYVNTDYITLHATAQAEHRVFLVIWFAKLTGQVSHPFTIADLTVYSCATNFQCKIRLLKALQSQ
jgi:hypothetical protein